MSNDICAALDAAEQHATAEVWAGHPLAIILEALIKQTRAALASEPMGEGPILQWTDNKPPCEECRYDHCTAETPFGRFLISWKSWKQFGSPTVDETPWGDWYGAFNSVDAAKAACQSEMDERLARWGFSFGSPPAPEPPAEALAARPLLERVARLGDCIGANTVGQIMTISNRAAAWLRDNPPGQPVALEPRGCPTPGACSCVEPVPPAPLTDLATRLISESRPIDPEMAEVLTPEARWDLYEGTAAPPAPEVGVGVGEAGVVGSEGPLSDFADGGMPLG